MATQGQYLAQGENMSAVIALFDEVFEAAYMNDQHANVSQQELWAYNPTEVLTEI